MVFPTVGTTLFPNGAMIRTLALSVTSNRLHDTGMTRQKIPFEIAMAIPAAALPVFVPAASRLPGCSFRLQDG